MADSQINEEIAVICAFHHGNAGMFSVDLAANQFLSNYSSKFDFIVGQTKSGEEFHNYGGIRFRVARHQSDLSRYSRILYWGDFLNNPLYGIGGFSGQDVGLGNSANKAEGYQAWKKIMMPDRGILGSAKVMSISNNFQNIDGGLPKGIVAELEIPFTEGFDLIFPRDPLSTASLTSAFPGSIPKVHEGVDAAFLWDARKEFGIPSKAPGEYFSFYFGRSKYCNADELVRSVSEITGLEAKPIDGWLSCRPSARNKIEGFIRQINDSRFVITDTYHCCVNTMNLGVPVIGLGVAAQQQKGTLGDHKKLVLFDMFGLSDFYVATASESISRQEMELLLLKALRINRHGVDEAVFDLLKVKKEVYSRALESAIFID